MTEPHWGGGGDDIHYSVYGNSSVGGFELGNAHRGEPGYGKGNACYEDGWTTTNGHGDGWGDGYGWAAGQAPDQINKSGVMPAA